MKKVLWECPIPEGYCYYVRKLEFEIAGTRIVVERLLREGRPVNDLFNRYEQEYRKLFAERGVLMHEITEEYLPEEYRTPEYTSYVDFHSNSLCVVGVGERSATREPT